MNLFHLFHRVHQKTPPMAHPPEPPHSMSPRVTVAIAGLLLLFGGCCILFLDHIYAVFPYILGALMLAAGILFVAHGLRTQEYQTRDTKLTSSGIVLGIVGTVILVQGHGADSLIGAAWGIIGLIEGSESLNHALYALAHRQSFWLEAFRAAVELILAILLLLDPAGKIHHHIVILGIEQICVALQFLHGLSREPSGVK